MEQINCTFKAYSPTILFDSHAIVYVTGEHAKYLRDCIDIDYISPNRCVVSFKPGFKVEFYNGVYSDTPMSLVKSDNTHSWEGVITLKGNTIQDLIECVQEDGDTLFRMYIPVIDMQDRINFNVTCAFAAFGAFD